MIKKHISIILLGCLVFGSPTLIVFAQTTIDQTDRRPQEIRAYVTRHGVSAKKRVKVRLLNGNRMNGYISSIGSDEFTLSDPETKQPVVIAYRDAKAVKGAGWPSSAKIALGVGIASAATLTILYVAFQRAIRDN